jgi:hypothetical protein
MGGGIGSRFWPFSRKTLPKQFLDFFGTGRSLLQQTFDRFQKVIPTENIFIVTNAMYADLVKEQLPEVNEDQILLEPVAKYLAEKLKMEVLLTETALDRGIKTMLPLQEPRIIMLQNLRFHAEEEANDREFANKLSQYGDVFVFDAFCLFDDAHRQISNSLNLVTNLHRRHNESQIRSYRLLQRKNILTNLIDFHIQFINLMFRFFNLFAFYRFRQNSFYGFTNLSFCQNTYFGDNVF